MVYKFGQDKFYSNTGQRRSSITSFRHKLRLRYKVKMASSNEHSTSPSLLDKLELLRANFFDFTVREGHNGSRHDLLSHADECLHGSKPVLLLPERALYHRVQSSVVRHFLSYCAWLLDRPLS